MELKKLTCTNCGNTANRHILGGQTFYRCKACRKLSRVDGEALKSNPEPIEAKPAPKKRAPKKEKKAPEAPKKRGRRKKSDAETL